MRTTRLVLIALGTVLALVPGASPGEALVPGVHPVTLLTGGDGDYVRLDDVLRPLGGRRRTDHFLGRSRIEVSGRDVALLAGTSLVVIDDGPPRFLSRPVRDEKGHTWVPIEFVTEVLPPVVSGTLTLTGAHLFVDTEPGRLDSVTVAHVGDTRAVSLHGRFPAGSRVHLSPGRARIALPGCVTGPDQLPGAAFDSLLTEVAVVDGRHGLEVELRLGPEITGYSPREETRSEIALLFGSTGDGLAPLDPAPEPARGEVVRVVLDPSHGGLDRGVRARGLEEKWVALELARTLADSLRAQGLEVFLTRNEDRDLLPEARASFANEIDGDLFLSFGIEDYGAVRTPDLRCLVHAPVASPAGSQVVAGFRLVPWTSAQGIHLEESRSAARWILRAMADPTRASLDREPDAAPLRTFEGLDMPAVMILLSPARIDADRWREGRERLASGLVDAVLGFAGRDRIVTESPFEGFGDPRDGRRLGDPDRERDRDRRQAERDRRDDRRPRPRGRGR